MNAAVQTFSLGDLNDELTQEQSLIDMFYEGVKEIRTLIESPKKHIMHFAVSQGSDSTVIELMGLEAYRQSIAENKIEAQRPLILSTVDTLAEMLPMNFYPRYAKSRIESYAKQVGINLYYDMITPPLNDQYFIKFAGGSKLIPNASRRGDCSIILKVLPNEKYIKGLKAKFDTMGYSSSKIISCVGSNLGESIRRKINMQKQQLAEKTIDDIFSEIETIKVGSSKILKYAPIRNWTKDDVFDLLRIAGSRPLSRPKSGAKSVIPAFFPDFSLLLEVYGNGTNSTCQVVIGQSNSSGCNGKARFGCAICTMVGATDKSSTALNEYVRWTSLGSENSLRFRDYLFRLSADMDARAMHARTIEHSGFCRVGLQPNVLKPKYLTKIIRYASMLTVDSMKIADDFKKLVEQGRELEHPGYREIYEDPYLPPRTKSAFLEMYKECAQDYRNLYNFFSLEHALTLSFRWSLDGIGAAPFEPLAIWQDTLNGKGRIAWPQLNSEYEALHGKVSIGGGELPEALMVPVLKTEDAASFAKDPINLLELWSRPLDISDLYDADRNCSITQEAKHNQPVKVEFKSSVAGLEVSDIQITKISVNGKTIAKRLYKYICDDDVLQMIKDKSLEAHPSKLEQGVLTSHLNLKLPYMGEQVLQGGLREAPISVAKSHNFTKRVTHIEKGRFIRKTTRLTFYKLDNEPNLYKKFYRHHSVQVPNFSYDSIKHIQTHDLDRDVADNIAINFTQLNDWIESGLLDEALEERKNYYKTKIAKRHQPHMKRMPFRSYGGTHVAEKLLRHGVITISKRYWDQLLSILKRTHVFNELGLFDYQSLSYEQVSKCTRAIDMKTHRSDKAKILIEARKLINEKRRWVRSNLASRGNGLADRVHSNYEQVMDSLTRSVKFTAYESIGYMSKLKFSFDTDFGYERKDKVHEYFLDSTFGDVKTIEQFLKLIVCPEDVKQLNENSALKLRILQQLVDKLSMVQGELGRAITNVHMFKSLMTKSDSLEQYKLKALHLLEKECSEWVPLHSWNPNEANFIKFKNAFISKLEGKIALLENLQSGIDDFTSTADDKVIGDMSLLDKLLLATA